MAQDLCLNLQNGTKLMVPNRLDAITTYVILEQERWFEKEWGFVEHLLQSGMTVLDIGANLGIYSIGMAKAVGPSGRVYAYEPTSETRARLEQSKAVNAADNLVIVPSALSDTEREGRIVFGASSELNRLGDGDDGQGEAVHLTSLDLEKKRLGWGAIDFIKMDAEGEELKIIAGGSSVFRDGAPIVMFEIKSETGFEPAIAQQFAAMGYGLFRLLSDEQHLVPFSEGKDAVDGFELNLFAVKPETATALAMRGVLVDVPLPAAHAGDWMQFVSTRPFAAVSPLFAQPLADGAYGRGLSAYAGWRDAARPLAERYWLLMDALSSLRAAADEERTTERLISLSRAEHDMGNRAVCNKLLVECATAVEAGKLPKGPFVPVSQHYENLVGELRGWLMTGLVEALQQRTTYSTYYGKALPQLDWVASTRYNTCELERRRALTAIFRGKPFTLQLDLGKPAPDHLNAETWAKLIG